MSWRILAVAVSILAWIAVSGCGQPGGTASSPSGGKSSAAKSAGHDHDHGHEHTSGPHGGHIIELGDEEYHAEWKHDDDSGKVTVYILDSEMKKEVPIAASEITITTQVGDNAKAYALAAANASEGDAPKASQFMLEDKALVVALQAAGHEGTSAKLEVEINGKAYSAAIEHDHGDEHGHKH